MAIVTVAELAPRPGELVVRKIGPSAFFATLFDMGQKDADLMSGEEALAKAQAAPTANAPAN